MSVGDTERNRANGGTLSIATAIGSRARGMLSSVNAMREVGIMGDCRMLETLEEVELVHGGSWARGGLVSLAAT